MPISASKPPPKPPTRYLSLTLSRSLSLSLSLSIYLSISLSLSLSLSCLAYIYTPTHIHSRRRKRQAQLASRDGLFMLMKMPANSLTHIHTHYIYIHGRNRTIAHEAPERTRPDVTRARGEKSGPARHEPSAKVPQCRLSMSLLPRSWFSLHSATLWFYIYAYSARREGGEKCVSHVGHFRNSSYAGAADFN